MEFLKLSIAGCEIIIIIIIIIILNGERFRIGVWVGSRTEQMRRQQTSLTFHATSFGLKQRK
jgi:hypothetical protein